MTGRDREQEEQVPHARTIPRDTRNVSEVRITRADDPRLARFYDEVYLPAFAHQREPLEAWQRALEGAAYALTIVLEIEDDRIDGGIVFERYPKSDVALITYLVVAPHARRRGVGSRLLDRAMHELAGARAIVGEVHDPAHADDPAAARKRIAWFEQRGARVLEIEYVQPDLGYGRDPHLKLISFRGDDVERALLDRFLDELYALTEGHRTPVRSPVV